MRKIVSNLKYVFKPRSVAIVGASSTSNKIGNVLLKNFIDERFSGKIYPVNPKHQEILGRKCFAKVSDIPGTVDLVVVATPAETVPGVVEDCAKKKVGGIVVLSGGFEEVKRNDLAQAMQKTCLENDIPLVGPNCLGIYNPYEKVDSIFLPEYKLERPRPGSVAFVTQSGAVGSTVMDLAAYYGLGISKFISYGNSTVLDESDYLEFLMHDSDTETIILYIEGAKDGQKLLETMKKVNKVKPVIALKAGKGIGGQAAARSHTGNIAGSYLAYHSAFKQAKVTEAEGIDELFDFVKIFNQPKPKGKRVGIITNGGGLGVLTTDSIEGGTLALASFSDATKAALQKILPVYGNIANPLDLVADADVNGYETSIQVMMDDPGIDALIIIVLTQTPPIDERIIHILSRYVDMRKKPIATISIGGTYTEAYRKIMEGKGVPSFSSPNAAVKAMEKLCIYAKYWNELRREG